MYRLRHPFSGAIYGALEDGLVHVEHRDGRTGTFDRYGRWVAGELRSADPEMCRWLGTHHGGAVTRHRAGFDGAGGQGRPTLHQAEGHRA